MKDETDVLCLAVKGRELQVLAAGSVRERSLPMLFSSACWCHVKDASV